jgi:hypothetical protein
MRHPSMRSTSVGPAVYERAPESRTLPTRGLTLPVGMRAGLLALGGAFLFLLALLCTSAFLIDGHCGERFGYYGCDLQH